MELPVSVNLNGLATNPAGDTSCRDANAGAGRSLPRNWIIPAIVILVYLNFLWTFGFNFSHLSQLDLGSFYWGAELTFQQHHSPYDLSAMARLTADTGQKVFPYLYPPSSLLVMSPLALLSYAAAAMAVMVVNQLCLLLIIHVLFRGILRFSPRQILGDILPATLLIYLISSRGVGLTIDYGQVNLIVLAMLCLSWWAMKADAPPWRIALPLAVATLIKTYPVLFIGLLLLHRDYRAVAWTGALLLLAVVLSLLVLPHGLWHDWLANVAPTGGFCKISHGLYSPAVVPNQGINGFVSRLCMKTDAGPALLHSRTPCVLLGYAMSIGVLIVTAAACFVARKNRRDSIDLQFSAFLIASFLVAPLAWEHHLTFVAPAVIVAILTLLRLPSFRKPMWIVAICVAAIVIAYPMPLQTLPLKQLPMLIVNSGKTYAVLVVWGMMIAAIWHTRRTELYWGHAENHA